MYRIRRFIPALCCIGFIIIIMLVLSSCTSTSSSSEKDVQPSYLTAVANEEGGIEALVLEYAIPVDASCLSPKCFSVYGREIVSVTASSQLRDKTPAATGKYVIITLAPAERNDNPLFNTLTQRKSLTLSSGFLSLPKLKNQKFEILEYTAD